MMPDTILHNHLIEPTSGRAYRYKPVMVSLLSKVTGVTEETVAKTKLYSRTPLRYIPFYPAQKGGGAITLGNKKWQSITFTENFYSDDTAYYGHKAYANKPGAWLRLSAHEAGHLHHAHRFKSLLIYLIVFVYQYARYGHDAAPLEIEADLGPEVLSRLSKHIKSAHGASLVKDCITTNISDSEKIALLDKWWASYSEMV